MSSTPLLRLLTKNLIAGGMVVLAVALGACASDSDEALPDPAPPLPGSLDAVDWPYANGDLAGTRSTTDSPIDSESVERLEVAWRVEVPGDGIVGSLATAPVIVDGVVWISDLNSNVYGLRLDDGTEVLRIHNDVSNFGPNGVAVGSGRVFAAPDPDSIAAYDTTTGEQIWRNVLTETSGGSVNIQPILVGETLLVATSSLAQPGSRGTLFALDAASGRVIWMFDTVESPDLWGMPELNSGGGAWYPPAVDLDARRVYWGTSNAYPWPGPPDFPFGSSRPGDNRWTNSTLALNFDTGELLWGHQHRPHDLFDLDSALTALSTTGDDSPLVISSGKYGRVVGLDPESGTVVFDTPVGIHENDDLQSWEGDIVVYPGYVGGVTTPLAVADGVVYVAVVNAPSELPAQPIDFEPDSPNFALHDGEMVAIDTADGSVRWDVEVNGQPFGGATVVNDLVFGSTLTGELFALNRTSGATVWSDQLTTGINGWPAVAGDTLVVPAGVDLGQGVGQLVAYRLSE